MQYEKLLGEVEQYVEGFFSDHVNKELVYHNRDHTRKVVKSAKKIANHYQLNEPEYLTVITAAWFHDTGYFINPSNHEEIGASLAEDFLQNKGIGQDIVHGVKACILKTSIDLKPENLLEEIIADAGLFHLGTDDFTRMNKMMRQEFRLLKNVEISKHDWRRKTILLLKEHRYHTDYCRILLTDNKTRNLEKLTLRPTGKSDSVEVQPEGSIEKPDVPGPVAKTKKKKRPAKGIETMFRISSANHQRLSDMADSKAHIMITVNSIIISVLLSGLLRNLEEFPQFTFPALLLVAVNLATITFSVLSTRPTLPRGVFTNDDVVNKKVNLLFFGNFYNMNLEDYDRAMKAMMNDKDFLYGTLIKDGYCQGVVLGKKYNLLRISYNVFMFGLIVAVLAFLVAGIWFR